MTVIARPIGRGNWSPMTLFYDGPQMAPFTCEVGERFTLGTVVWRICEVKP